MAAGKTLFQNENGFKFANIKEEDMLIFTNRVVDETKRDETAFGRAFKPFDSRLGLAYVERGKGGAGARWKLTNPDADVDVEDSMKALRPLFNGKKPVLVYIHGNNNTPEKCFERCERLGALYDVEVVGFSWASEGFTSEGQPLQGVPAPDTDDEDDIEGAKDRKIEKPGTQGKIRRYHQAKTNAQDSAEALARFFRMVAAVRLIANQPFTVAAHSLGCYFLQNTLGSNGAQESLGAAENVALLAACTNAAGHADWVAKIHPKGQVFVTYNKGDTVLLGANIADGGQTKLGGDLTEFSQVPKVRYISFTGAQVGAWGHRYFVRDKMPNKALTIFKRVFSSQKDIQGNELPRKIYPVGCEADGRICYMAGSAIEER
jgi:hypothetical protein